MCNLIENTYNDVNCSRNPVGIGILPLRETSAEGILASGTENLLFTFMVFTCSRHYKDSPMLIRKEY